MCWRLARQLASELGQSVRLWVDDLASFHRLCRGVDPAQALQVIDRVEVRHWCVPFQQVAPSDIVVEGFGVRLPDAYREAMAARLPHPVWINLEYLSAENWVEGCHGLPSPQPGLGLVKYFFFPGFTSATGGLCMERGLTQARDVFQGDTAAIAAFWRSLDVPQSRALRVSLFCYGNAALPALVEAWSSDRTPVACVVPEGAALAQLSRIAGRRMVPGSRIELGALSIVAIPFLDMDQYDRLLWACDVNFVRGEDSFVRAQLAARPLVWQAYPQDASAHVIKSAAFLARYASALDPAAGTAYRKFADAWNRESADVGNGWATLLSHREALVAHARNWADNLAIGTSLAIKLADFCEDRLKCPVL